VIRRLYEYRRRFQQGRPVTWEQWQSVRAFVRLQRAGVTLYMARSTWNVLQTRPATLTDPIFRAVQALEPARYMRRWARRLRDLTFAREDALMLSLAVFGLDPQRGTLGVDWFVTTDLALLKNAQAKFPTISSHFEAMITQLPAPYNLLVLPELLSVDDVLARL
jgi:hypothetical protein